MYISKVNNIEDIGIRKSEFVDRKGLNVFQRMYF